MNKVGIGLAALLFLSTANSTHYFLNVMKVSPLEWLVFNACAPSNIAYLSGFVIYLASKDRTALHIAILPLFFFGGLGLFIFPWNGYNLIAQVSHILMVSTIAWVLYETFRTADYKSAAVGLLLGILFFAPFIGFQQNYAAGHPEAFNRILGFDMTGKPSA